jgi:hypothetical protein
MKSSGVFDKGADVTVKVRSLVEGLSLDFAVETHVLGDPLPGKSKVLEVVYMQGGEQKTVAVAGGNGLRIKLEGLDPTPQQRPGHIVRAWYGHRQKVLGKLCVVSCRTSSHAFSHSLRARTLSVLARSLSVRLAVCHTIYRMRSSVHFLYPLLSFRTSLRSFPSSPKK